MSGLELSDLDRDGDVDILFTNGDEGDGPLPEGVDPHEFHGLKWLENDGAQNFTRHRVLGAPQQLITIDAADINRDGVPKVLGGSYNNCVFVDPKCGPFGHRLVAFNIGVPARPALPTVGDTTVGKLMSGALAGGLTLVVVDVALLRIGRRTRGRTRSVRLR